MPADNILGYTDINVTLFRVCQQITHLVILISMLHYSVYVSRWHTWLYWYQCYIIPCMPADDTLGYTDINVTLFRVCQQITHLIILISMLHNSVYVSRLHTWLRWYQCYINPCMSADNTLGYTGINVTLFRVCQQITPLVILISMLHYSVYVSR